MQEFLAIGLITLLAAMSPGPDFFVVMKNALKYNRKVGVFTSIGVALGIMVHVTYILIGIGVIVSKSILLYSLIKYLGALYLVYLGVKMLISKSDVSHQNISKSQNVISSLAAFKQGFLTNVLNPKATVFFLSVFTQVITPSTAVGLKWAYGFEMAVIALMWFTLLSLLLGNSFVRNKISRVQMYVDKFMGAVLVLLGVKIAFSKN